MELGFSFCGYVYTAPGYPQYRASTSKRSPDNLALAEEQYPGVGQLLGQEWHNLIADTSHHSIPSWVSAHSTVFCWVGTTRMPQNYICSLDTSLVFWDAGRMGASRWIRVPPRRSADGHTESTGSQQAWFGWAIPQIPFKPSFSESSCHWPQKGSGGLRSMLPFEFLASYNTSTTSVSPKRSRANG